jgi:hypothetical protein
MGPGFAKSVIMESLTEPSKRADATAIITTAALSRTVACESVPSFTPPLKVGLSRDPSLNHGCSRCVWFIDFRTARVYLIPTA